jgi:hypothetical protein
MHEDIVPKQDVKGNVWTTLLSYATYLLFWLVLTASSLWLMYEVRNLAVELMIVAELNPWAVRGFDRWIIFLLGLIWFVGMIWMEHYLRTGINKKRLWRNVALLTAVQVIVLAVVYSIRFVINL